MPDGPQTPASRGLRIVAITADADFEQSLRATFGRSAQIDLAVVAGAVGGTEEKLPLADATVLLVDLDATRSDEIAALQNLARRLAGSVPILVVTAGFSESVARQLIQLRIADFLVKPVDPVELVRACGRVAKSSAADGATEAEIYTFLPAAGGVGVTTLAVETAMLLMRRTPRGGVSTCLVDLDFQHGACADYLDIEPRLDIGEIEPRPERLDGQLLEVMLSQHGSGLAVIAAPNRPAEMRSFDADVATRLLDMVSSRFDHVVIDMPRTWFAWTDSVLLGSNRLFVVTEMTVPGVRHAKQLVAAISERLKGGPQPQVIVNRFEQQLFGSGLRRADIEQALGAALGGTIPNNYRLVREAIDRGVPLEEVRPGNNVSAALKKLLFPPTEAKAGSREATGGAAAEPGSAMGALRCFCHRAGREPSRT
ncbi:MAG: response regulator [Alphaproteobacteria bacterium]|nr:MAG: response regulator [Alphaproteobacteria bacterium]